MKQYKNTFFYIATIAGFSGLIYFVLQKGLLLENKKVAQFVPQLSASTWHQFTTTFLHNITYPLAILLLQIITIICVARMLGFLCKKIGQPSVIGEIVAGILLGPSFLGNYFHGFSAFLFPAQSLGNLQFLSQIGLILFMFVIGMELDLQVLKNKAREAVVISHASIIFPFALGIVLSYFVYAQFAPANVKFLSFSLFIGISMSVTAFPVLARIVQERGLSKTRLGTIAITCAAADDITAWCLLAAVIAVVKAGSILSAFYTILMAAGYVLLMIKVVQPFLKKLGEKYSNKESFSKPVVAIFFITLLASSYATEVIGIHALFGAFLAGVIMPANASFRSVFIEKVEDLALVLLLPLFFVFTGLRTQIGLLNHADLWKVCGWIVLVAVTGKFLGSTLAAKFVGQNWKESLSIGALMNTRGLRELVVLNIGYDLGVLNPEIFAMLVIMALVTTFMTGPALVLINRFLPDKKTLTIPSSVQKTPTWNILVAFSGVKKGLALLTMANLLVKKSVSNAGITMMHLSPSNDLNQYNLDEYERTNFEPVEAAARDLQLTVTTMFKPSLQIDSEISHTANTGNFDLLLVGIGRSVFQGTLLGKILGFTTKIINPERLYETITGREKLFENSLFDERVKAIIKNTKVPVGIFADKGMAVVKNVFIPLFSISDSFLLIYAQKLIHNDVRIVIVDAAGVIRQNPELKDAIRSIENASPQQLSLHKEAGIDDNFLSDQHLLLISMEGWRKAIEQEAAWLPKAPSTLIIKP